ncbi:integrase [Endozoicomonas sp. OPT23]|uniref:phage integrase n=1 Tax=Endozoicomonas sp. OPT23 TaxID=2072845 RepID=UPI00129A0E86|nr:tyrosine-type recombinase/integrase [Endozoicomonas sp. OPT23]MRI32685.1 integrase [Endozoicomonas sp. OPT23]
MKIIKNKKTGKWTLDVEPIKNKRFRKTCNTKTECMEYYRQLMEEIEEKSNAGIKLDEEDNRRLSDLINLWYKGTGCELSDHVRLKSILDKMAEIMGNVLGRSLTIAHYNHYKAVKRSENFQGRVIGDNTLNKHLGYLSTVFNYLYDIEEVDYPNPLKKARKIKIDEKELSFLTLDQVDILLTKIKEFSANPHVLLITKLCLATGARWSEIESRELHHFHNSRVEFTKTKGKKTRNVPIPDDLFRETVAHLTEHGRFSASASAFSRALKASGIRLPRGQRSHVLRHTFASHFMMNRGNIIVLQRILGHTDLKMTMKYAKFEPDHFKEAALLNPLTTLNKQKSE